LRRGPRLPGAPLQPAGVAADDGRVPGDNAPLAAADARAAKPAARLPGALRHGQVRPCQPAPRGVPGRRGHGPLLRAGNHPPDPRGTAAGPSPDRTEGFVMTRSYRPFAAPFLALALAACGCGGAPTTSGEGPPPDGGTAPPKAEVRGEA